MATAGRLARISAGATTLVVVAAALLAPPAGAFHVSNSLVTYDYWVTLAPDTVDVSGICPLPIGTSFPSPEAVQPAPRNSTAYALVAPCLPGHAAEGVPRIDGRLPDPSPNPDFDVSILRLPPGRTTESVLAFQLSYLYHTRSDLSEHKVLLAGFPDNALLVLKAPAGAGFTALPTAGDPHVMDKDGTTLVVSAVGGTPLSAAFRPLPPLHVDVLGLLYVAVGAAAIGFGVLILWAEPGRDGAGATLWERRRLAWTVNRRLFAALALEGLSALVLGATTLATDPSTQLFGYALNTLTILFVPTLYLALAMTFRSPLTTFLRRWRLHYVLYLLPLLALAVVFWALPNATWLGVHNGKMDWGFVQDVLNFSLGHLTASDPLSYLLPYYCVASALPLVIAWQAMRSRDTPEPLKRRARVYAVAFFTHDALLLACFGYLVLQADPKSGLSGALNALVDWVQAMLGLSTDLNNPATRFLFDALGSPPYPLILLVFLPLLAYGIVKHDLFDIHAPLRRLVDRLVRYLGAAPVGGIAFALVSFYSKSVVDGPVGTLAGGGVGVVVAYLLANNGIVKQIAEGVSKRAVPAKAPEEERVAEAKGLLRAEVKRVLQGKAAPSKADLAYFEDLRDNLQLPGEAVGAVLRDHEGAPVASGT